MRHGMDPTNPRACKCGRTFKSSKSVHLHATKANKAERGGK